MEKKFIYCDIEDCVADKDVEKRQMQVLFTTDQTEGRSVPTHLSNEQIDICPVCLDKILKGQYLYGAGAQGYNRYWFKEDETKKLLHHKDTTVGLWATDKPDLLSDEEKKKCHLFEIVY